MKLLFENWREYLLLEETDEAEEMNAINDEELLNNQIINFSSIEIPNIPSEVLIEPAKLQQNGIIQSVFIRNLSEEQKIMIRGALFSLIKEISSLTQEQIHSLQHLIWVLDNPEETSQEIEYYLNNILHIIKNSPPKIKKIFKSHGYKNKIQQQRNTSRKDIKNTDRPYVEKTKYDWSTR